MSTSTSHHLGEDLSAMADGGAALEPAKRAELTAHVAGCAACQQAIAEAQQIFSALEAQPALEPSSSFDRSLFAKLDAADAAAQPSLLARLKAWLQPPQIFVGAAMAAAAAAALVIWAPAPTPALSEQPALMVLASGEDVLDVAENLELLEDLELFEQLDALEDLDVIEQLELEAG